MDMSMSMSPSSSAAMASSTAMSGMGTGGSCKISMLWNWYTVDACRSASQKNTVLDLTLQASFQAPGKSPRLESSQARVLA